MLEKPIGSVPTPSPEEGVLLRELASRLRADPRIRSRHVRIRVMDNGHAVEIGGRPPPWWHFAIDLRDLAKDPQGVARDIVNAWLSQTTILGG